MSTKSSDGETLIPTDEAAQLLRITPNAFRRLARQAALRPARWHWTGVAYFKSGARNPLWVKRAVRRLGRTAAARAARAKLERLRFGVAPAFDRVCRVVQERHDPCWMLKLVYFRVLRVTARRLTVEVPLEGDVCETVCLDRGGLESGAEDARGFFLERFLDTHHRPSGFVYRPGEKVPLYGDRSVADAASLLCGYWLGESTPMLAHVRQGEPFVLVGTHLTKSFRRLGACLCTLPPVAEGGPFPLRDHLGMPMSLWHGPVPVPSPADADPVAAFLLSAAEDAAAAGQLVDWFEERGCEDGARRVRGMQLHRLHAVVAEHRESRRVASR
jgi:hypothetical protein